MKPFLKQQKLRGSNNEMLQTPGEDQRLQFLTEIYL